MAFFSLFSKKVKSASLAKKRIQNILLSDRADCSTNIIDAIKEDVGRNLSKYMEIDIERISLEVVPDSKENELYSKMYMVIRIPFREINKVIY